MTIVTDPNKAEIALEFVELAFEGQAMQRPEMWQFQESQRSKCLCIRQKVKTGDYCCRVNSMQLAFYLRTICNLYNLETFATRVTNSNCYSALVRNKKEVLSGVVNKQTKIIWRSRVCAITWLIQVKYSFHCPGDGMGFCSRRYQCRLPI